MDNSARTLKRNLLFNTVGNIIYFVCQWLITGFFVKRLSGDAGLVNAGLLATAMAATNVFLTLASYGMRTYQVSDISDKYSSGDYIASRFITVAAALLLCAGYTFAVGYGGEQAACIMIYLVYKLSEAATDVIHGCAQKRERMDIIGISYAARGVISVALFCLSLLMGKSLVFALGAMTAGCWIFCALYDLRAAKPYYSPARRSDAKAPWRLLLECAPLAVYVFMNTAVGSIPKLALERISGTVAIGIYNLVNSPVLILQVGVAFLFTPFITLFSGKLASGDTRGFRALAAKITLGVFAVGLLAALAMLTPLGAWGLQLLYGDPSVTEQSGLLVPMAACTVLTSLALFYCMLLTVLRDMKGLIISTALGIAVSALISAPLISASGMFGASYATIAALLAECAALVYFVLRGTKPRDDFAKNTQAVL